MRKSLTILFVLALVGSVAGVTNAQTETKTTATEGATVSTVELRSATVIAAFHDLLVIENQDGDIIDFIVPEGLLFNIDGQQLKSSELKPGTRLTAAVETTQTAEKEVTTTIRTGEVLHVQGKTVFVRSVDGVKKVVPPDGFIFTVNGEPKTIKDLGKGMKFTATIVTETPPVITIEKGLASEITGTAPVKAAAPVAEPAPVTPPPVPGQLPATASKMPLIGLMGLISLLMAAVLTLTRRLG